MTGYKILTHDLRSPIRRGEPIWDGSVPYELPESELDRSEESCGAGWNFCTDPEVAGHIAGLWPGGRPARLFEVEPHGEVIDRGDKSRAAKLTIRRELPIDAACQRLPHHTDRMVAEQVKWHAALGRPHHNPDAVRDGLRRALEKRGLDWRLKRFETAWAAWDARDAWAARDAWDAWAARNAWAARDAWAAWAALTATYAALNGWTDHDPMLLTTGLRSAHTNGLAVATPTGPNELGWAMEED